MLQELLPDHVVKEGKSTADKGKGTTKQWPFGWGKKKGDKDQEPLPAPDAEVLKVSPQLSCIVGDALYTVMMLVYLSAS